MSSESLQHKVLYIVNGIKKQLLKCWFFVKPAFIWFLNVLFPVNAKAEDIPIIINNRNRFTFLKDLIKSLEDRGYRNIYIIDNNSSYPPLLEYYKNEYKYRLYALKDNLGHMSLWESGIIKEFKNNYFVYTDPDVVIDKDCPADFMQLFLDILNKKSLIEKVGFSLRIDDLPNHFADKEKVISWESTFWIHSTGDNPKLYKASIDTTFALYRPHYITGGNLSSPHIRVGFPYTAKHMPWYNDSANLDAEEIFYKDHCESMSHWVGKSYK